MVSAILEFLKKLLGIKSSEARRFDALEKKLVADKAKNIDKLEEFKDKVRQMEAQLRRKKAEMDEVKGDLKRVVAKEIERLFRDLDRMRGQETIIAANLDRISIAQAKLEEYKLAVEKGLDEDELDDLALDLKEAFESMQIADRTVRDLDKVAYQPPERSAVEAEKRMAEVTGAQETETTLSEDIEKRLLELEAE